MNAPVAVPDPPAASERLRESAIDLRATADRFEFAVSQALFTWNLLPAAYRAPEADELHAALATTRPVSDEVKGGLLAACRALERFADEIDDLARRRDLLCERRDAGAPTDLWDETVEGRGVELNERRRDEWRSDLTRQAAALAEAYEDATRRCAQALRAIPEVRWATSVAWGGMDVEIPVGSLTDAAGLALLRRVASAPDPGALLEAHPDWTSIIRATDPAKIADWWSRLDRPVASALVTAIPLVIGNLDGVAVDDRVEANRLRVDEHLRDLRRRLEQLRSQRVPGRRTTAMDVVDGRAERKRLEDEIAYFENVRDGAKMLYAWDPARGALIEMSGHPSSAEAALFVVPGTNAEPGEFMRDKPVTRFAEWQVTASGSSVLAFTILTGPMPQVDGDILRTGPEWNTYAVDRGPEYARFIQGIKANRPDLWTMSYEHSYGGGVGSEAEKHGGTVDARFLAASVGAIGPYEPHPGTQYFATQATDDINRYYAGVGLGSLGFTVAPETIPGVHIVDSGLPGPDIGLLTEYAYTQSPGVLFGIVGDSIDHHTALMSDDESINGPVLRKVRDLIAAKGAIR